MMSGERPCPGATSATDQRTGASSQTGHAANCRTAASPDQTSCHRTRARRSAASRKTESNRDDGCNTKRFSGRFCRGSPKIVRVSNRLTGNAAIVWS
jgi:hypothetical protein